MSVVLLQDEAEQSYKLSFLHQRWKEGSGMRCGVLWGTAWGETVKCKKFKGCVRSGLVLSDVNGLLLGSQQAVHGCRHRLHVNLRKSQTEQNIQFTESF